MLLEEISRLPKDIKIKVDFDGQSEDFLGFYGQISLNNVQGIQYPYFYVVLVARKNYGLENYKDMVHRKNLNKGLFSKLLDQNQDFICEYSEQEDVEVLVIRQYTTKTSGYHTDSSMVKELFESGIEVAEMAAQKRRM